MLSSVGGFKYDTNKLSTKVIGKVFKGKHYLYKDHI